MDIHIYIYTSDWKPEADLGRQELRGYEVFGTSGPGIPMKPAVPHQDTPTTGQ